MKYYFNNLWVLQCFVWYLDIVNFLQLLDEQNIKEIREMRWEEKWKGIKEAKILEFKFGTSENVLFFADQVSISGQVDKVSSHLRMQSIWSIVISILPRLRWRGRDTFWVTWARWRLWCIKVQEWFARPCGGFFATLRRSRPRRRAASWKCPIRAFGWSIEVSRG